MKYKLLLIIGVTALIIREITLYLGVLSIEQEKNIEHTARWN